MMTHRLLFIGGVHRSGTTPLASALARHPQLSGFTGTGVPAEEGQHLQSTYTPARKHGGPGKFALAPEAHLTETDGASPSAARRQLYDAWQPHWNMTCPVLVEKSPPNLVRFRYLQSIFPKAHCLAIVRHPASVALATQRMRPRPLGALLRHWLHAHALLLDDAPHVENLALVYYEHFVSAPEATISSILRWLGVEPSHTATNIRDENKRYFAKWQRLTGGWRQPRGQYLIRTFEHDVNRFGYSLVDLQQTPTQGPHVLRPWQLPGRLPVAE